MFGIQLNHPPIARSSSCLKLPAVPPLAIDCLLATLAHGTEQPLRAPNHVPAFPLSGALAAYSAFHTPIINNYAQIKRETVGRIKRPRNGDERIGYPELR
jgi:hypothetical protein